MSVKKIMKEINNLKSVKKPNCLFRNNDDYWHTFLPLAACSYLLHNPLTHLKNFPEGLPLSSPIKKL